MPETDKWYKILPWGILPPDNCWLYLSTEAGNEWEVNVLQLKGSNRSYVKVCITEMSHHLRNNCPMQWQFVGFAVGCVLLHVSQLTDGTVEPWWRRKWLLWPPVDCTFSGNRGKFMEEFLGSPAARTTHIWQKWERNFQSPERAESAANTNTINPTDIALVDISQSVVTGADKWLMTHKHDCCNLRKSTVIAYYEYS